MSSPTTSVLPRHPAISNWWYLLPVFVAAWVLGFFTGLQKMALTWLTVEEYSHGILLPMLAAYLIWRRRDELMRQCWKGHWIGLLVVVCAVVINLMGQLAAVFTLQQYAFVLSLYGMVLAMGGWRLFRELLAPLLLLFFMVPLPNFFMNNLSAQLQLLSSQLGVAFIRLVGISVFLEGNVIDLGSYKLQVAEACSGLRYLFPLLTMGFIMAYLFKAAWWKRVLVFLSAIPLTIGMNSVRIGIIGVLVDRWGTAMAEGFLHEFEGWVIFMVSTGAMFGEIVLLSQMGRNASSWRKSFGFARGADLNVNGERIAERNHRTFAGNLPLLFAALLVVFTSPLAWALPKHDEQKLARESFLNFPTQIDAWNGRRGQLDQVYLDTLMLDDYFIGDYGTGGHNDINLYMAWYDSQEAGRSAHSPRSCLPGGGWRIKSIESVRVQGAMVSNAPLTVNRVLIESGKQRQLVYYWFQQRGRVITNEYVVKWYLFWDALTRHRSDGALVRVIVPVAENGSVQAAELRLAAFTRALSTKLSAYIPG